MAESEAQSVKAYANMYYRARMQAAQREPLHASRERTASEIFVSCEALADYETGRTVPPCDVVQKMVEAYNDPDLKAAHIRACCPLLPDYGGEGCSELARAALGWAIAFQSAQDIALQFATVARDGRIPSMQLGNRTLVDVDAASGVLSPEPEGVKIDVVSEETGLTVTAIRRAVRDGWLPYIKPGKAYLFRMEDVRAAIEKRMEEQAKKDS